MTTSNIHHATDRETPAQQQAHVHEILSKLSNVMLLSFASTGAAPSISGRPLHIAKLDDDGTLWFVVAMDGTHVQQIQRYDHVLITGQDGSRWIHLDGRADVVTDVMQIQAVWNKMHEIWFPNGPTDPNVCLLRVRVIGAEYWDTSGMNGVKYIFEAARALVTGTAAQPISGSHGEVGTKL